MTARSPNDSAGEHNKGSRWTANLLSEGGRNETECSEVSCAGSEWSLWLYARPPLGLPLRGRKFRALIHNPDEMNGCVGNERSVMQCNGGQLNEVGLQDTGAAVRNDAAKAKGMTAVPRNEGEPRWPTNNFFSLHNTSQACGVSAGVIFCGKE